MFYFAVQLLRIYTCIKATIAISKTQKQYNTVGTSFNKQCLLGRDPPPETISTKHNKTATLKIKFISYVSVGRAPYQGALGDYEGGDWWGF